ncbi:alpha-crystallin B chain [Aplysia californica]|uniref:Alpha-crystallin B chain n=1 Tax=Aplysia californica TaxID=6500 RepID=A0ABM0JXK0_APLCA|nr:alpha-crystallin B chain [Aplysia californica]
MEHLVPLRRETWSFFERQRKVFSDAFKGMDSEWDEFDKELERMRKEMFTLKALDFNDFGSSMIKPERPIVSDAEGNKRLSLRFDCKDFKPEEITVKTMNNQLMVQAKHTEESPGRKVYREFSRQYILPHKIDPLTLNSILAADGVLSIEAPAPEAAEAPRERILPIKRL